MKYLDNRVCVIYVDLTIARDSKIESFASFVTPKRVGRNWIVDNKSYRSLDSLGSLEKYLAEFTGWELISNVGSKRNRSLFRSQVEPLVDGLTFGSQTMLDSCWSPSELSGKSEEKTIIKLGRSEKKVPLLPEPQHSLPPLSPAERNSIRSITPHNDQKYIALTFDLCETSDEIAGYDAAIVDYLRDHRIKVTFFAGGKWLASHKERALQLIADPLFEVGNHSWSHKNLRILKQNEIEKEILWTQAQYEVLRNELEERKCADPKEMNKIPSLPMVFRFPFGTCNAESLQMLAGQGIAAIQWDVVTGDPAKRQTAEGIARTVRNRVRPGSIIICHANGRGHGTAEALPLFVSELSQRGYKFVTVSELLRLGKIKSTSECFELTPGDNLLYDRIGKGRK